jgi:hypothetical protein
MKNWIRALLMIAAGCSAVGSETVQTFTVDYPESAAAPIVLEISSGTLNVTPGEGSGVQGQVTTNVRDWMVSQSADADGTQRVVQGSTRSQVIPNAVNRWDVTLGTGQSLGLVVNHGAAAANLELGDVPLRSLEVNGASGNLTVTFASANPLADSTRARIQTVNGNVTINGVFNSRFTDWSVVSGAGNVTVELGNGDLMHDLNTTIETRVGDIALRIPLGTAARVMFTGSSGRVLRVSPEFVETSRYVYETAEYTSGSRPRVQFSIRTTAGDLSLVVVPAR